MSEEREWYGDGLPPVGMTCVAVPHGTDWGFDSLDPVGVVIKAYDGDFVWMLANREHYITTHISKLKFFPVATQQRTEATEKPLSVEELQAGGWHIKRYTTEDYYLLAVMGLSFLDEIRSWSAPDGRNSIEMPKGWPKAGKTVGPHQPEIYRKGVHFYWKKI